MGVSQVMEIESSVVCLTQVLTRQIAAKEKTSTWKMAKSDATWTFLLFLLWFIPFTHFSSLLHSATCRNEKNKIWGRSKSRKHRTRSRVPDLYLFFFCLHLFSPLWTLQMKQKRMLLNLADRRTDITKETEVTLSPNVTLSLPKTGPLEYLEISVILPRQLLDWVHFKSISIMMLASILLARAQEPTTLDSSYCKGGRMTSHQEHSLQRQHTKPGSITDILSGSCTLQSWQFFYFLL